MELGVFSFGDLNPHPVTGEAPTARQKMRQLVAMAKQCDELGLDIFAVGEHHRLDMVVSSPAVVLAACAEATSRIRLSSATTVLNTLDPVRVYEDFASLDLLSGSRAELILGRGSFTENFDLFGHDMKDYDALFAENLELMLQLNRDSRVTWHGRFRAPLRDAQVSPRPEQAIPMWIGVGGTPQSAARAGRLGLPMTIAILASPGRFAPLAEHYRRAGLQAGHSLKQLRVAVSSHGYLDHDDQGAKDAFWEVYSRNMRNGLANRFPGRDIPREAYDHEVGPQGGIFAGDADDLVRKAEWQRDILGMDRLMLQFDFGGVGEADVRRSIDILGEALPRIRAL